MPAKRAILENLTAAELRAIVDQHDLAVEDRRVHAQLVEAVAASRKVALADVLGDYSRDRLKEVCRALGLDDSGREKTAIVERLGGSSKTPDATAVDPPRQAALALGGAEAPAGRPARRASRAPAPAEKNVDDLGFERKLFQAADMLRNSRAAAAGCGRPSR